MLGGEELIGSGKRVQKKWGRRPRVVAATAVGTLAAYSWFLYLYTRTPEENSTSIWFGVRADGRCGTTFKTDWVENPKCGRGHCCSSHGWCGHGEEYCSVTQGCQNGCWEEKVEAQAVADRASLDAHHGEDGHEGKAPDDDEYMGRMNKYGYGEGHAEQHGGHGSDGYNNGYNKNGYRDDYHHGSDHNDEHYHHRYDDDPDAGIPGGQHHRDMPYGDDEHYHEHGIGAGEDQAEHEPGDLGELEHEGGHHGDGSHGGEGHGGEGHGAEGGAEGGPQLVGLSEKEHLGVGDHVPLEGHPEEKAD